MLQKPDVEEMLGRWENLYDANIFESLKGYGQINPCLVRWWKRHEQWLVEPGQCRWYAMRALEWKTFKVVLYGDTNPFPEYDHQTLPDLDAVAKLYDANFYATRKWFEKQKWFEG